MAITTPARVRNRIQAAESDISEDVLDKFIADEQAFVETYACKTFPETDLQFALAQFAPIDAQPRPWLTYRRRPPASRIRSLRRDERKVDKINPIPLMPIYPSQNRGGRKHAGGKSSWRQTPGGCSCTVSGIFRGLYR